MKNVELMTEEQTVKLQGKQLVFAENFLKFNFNGSMAVLNSGFNNKDIASASVQANRLLKDAKVAAYIEQRKKQLLDEIGVTTFRVLKELAAIAFADIRDYYDENGALKNVSTLSASAAAALICVDVFEVYGMDGEKVGETKRTRFHDKMRALELLGKYLNMFEKDNKSSAPQVSLYDVTLNIK